MNMLKRAAKRVIHGIQNIYTNHQKAPPKAKATKQEWLKQHHPQQDPNQSKKLKRVERTSFINNFVSDSTSNVQIESIGCKDLIPAKIKKHWANDLPKGLSSAFLLLTSGFKIYTSIPGL